MQNIKKYFMTLALLITAVGGAWAQGPWASGDCTVTLSNGTLTVSGNGTMDNYPNIDQPWADNSGGITSVVVENGVTSVGMAAFYYFTNMTSVTLPEGLTAINDMAFANCSSLQSITIPSTVTSIGVMAFNSCSAITSITLSEGLTAIGDMAFYDCYNLTSITIPSTVTSIGNMAFMSSSAISDVNLYANPDNLTWGDTSMDFKPGKATQCHVLAEHLSTYQTKFSSANVTFVGDLQPLADPNAVEVTTNAASEGATFTEASFKMPAFDATAEYELVRDITQKVDVETRIDGAATERIRIAKDNEGHYKFVTKQENGWQFAAVDKLDNNKDLTNGELTYSFKMKEGDEYEAVNTETDLCPGIWRLEAEANADKPYDGIAYGPDILLYDFKNISFAKGYTTHYYSESLVLDEVQTGLHFYAVTAVTAEKVTLTEIEGKAIPGGTPFIVYNETAEPITAVMGMLQAADVTSATEFKGTAEDKKMNAQSGCYILRNGDSTPTFRLVEGAGTLPAHRCYIDLGAAAGSRSLGFDFGDGTTGIGTIGAENDANGEYYDLQGRKHQGTPQRKGVYVKDGRKVIVR